jgi:hypothetical protein
VKRQDSLTGVKALLQRGSAFLQERGFFTFSPIASRLPHSTTDKTVMVDPQNFKDRTRSPPNSSANTRENIATLQHRYIPVSPILPPCISSIFSPRFSPPLSPQSSIYERLREALVLTVPQTSVLPMTSQL